MGKGNLGEEETATAARLLRAAIEGDALTVKIVLALHRELVDATDDDGETPLIKATWNGRDYIVYTLLHAGARVDYADGVGITALMHACAQGHEKIVRSLLTYGANVVACARDMGKYGRLGPLGQHAASRQQYSTLTFAAIGGNAAIVMMLLMEGVNVNGTLPGDVTPLMIASLKGFADVVTVLLAAGADARVTCPGYWIALTFAARNGHADCVAALLKHSTARVNHVDTAGFSPLVRACLEGHVNVARVLLAAGAKNDPSSRTRDTALGCAVRGGHAALVELLLTNRTEVNVEHVDKRGNTALLSAVRRDRVDIIKLMLAARVDVNRVDRDGEPVLIKAVRRGQCGS